MRSLMTKLVVGVLCLFVAGVLLLAALWTFWRPGLAEYQDHLASEVHSAGNALHLRWLGVSSALLSDGKTTLLIDPFFSRPGGLLKLLSDPEVRPDRQRIRQWLDAAGIENLDAVLVSHSHYDHAMDAGIVAQLSGAVLLGSSSTLNIGRGAGLPDERLIELPQDFSLGDFRIRFIASRHAGATGGYPTGDINQPLTPPARLSDYRQGGSFSIWLQHPRQNILHHGSAGFEPAALRGVQAETVLLGVALIDDMERYWQEVVVTTGARRVIPVHWDDFTRPLDQPLSPMPLVVDLPGFFSFASGKLGVQVETLPLNTPLSLVREPM